MRLQIAVLTTLKNKTVVEEMEPQSAPIDTDMIERWQADNAIEAPIIEEEEVITDERPRWQRVLSRVIDWMRS